MEELKRLPIFLRFSLLLIIIFFTSLFLFLQYNPKEKISPNTGELPNQHTSDIKTPEITFTEIEKDSDLKKLPQDYDSLLNTLNISFTQHQKASLLLYGESIVKSNETDINDGYRILIEKDIPILIPQEYINIYLETEILQNYTPLPVDFHNAVSLPLEQDTTSRDIYEEYIKGQFKIYQSLPSRKPINTFEKTLSPSNFLIDADSKSINSAYYKLRILRASEKQAEKVAFLTNFLNDLVTYTNDSSDINAYNRLKQSLKYVIYNEGLKRGENIYWKLKVIEGRTYVYPVLINEEFALNDNNFGEPYDLPPKVQSKGTIRVPIFMYHQIDQVPPNGSQFLTGLYVSPEVFEEQLAYLVKKNYKSVTPQELYNLLSEGKNPSQKSVMITFDDSTKSQYDNAYPLLKKYGMTGVFYVVTNRTSITYDQLREMANNGMIIDSHTSTHPDLVKIYDSSRLSSEIVESRHTLKSATGQSVSSIAYPGCVIDSKGYEYVRQAGYLIGVSCGRSIDHTLGNRLSLSRVHVFNSLDNLKNLLSGLQ